jgi:exopolyphosphatase/guanosine-5'-triphosphate,3'-diphosphate pyrophosphatase
LAGFQPRELELIANVARYHRGAEPKKRHGNFRQLSKDDRHRVRRLASILRIAGGLDRSHTQQVRDVIVARSESGIHLQVISDENPEVDLWGARRRSEFFEQVFLATLTIDWHLGESPRTEPSPAVIDQPLVEDRRIHNCRND